MNVESSKLRAREKHWQDVYRSKAPEEVSWRQDRPEVSLALIADCRLAPEAAILDVGGGASTLADALLDAGHRDLTVLDVSEQGLAHLRDRLGARAEQVRWIVADITQWTPDRGYVLWHDRAVLHFLVEPEDQAAYARALRAAVAAGGWVIIAGFAPGGPEKCSGLPIVQHDAASLGALLGAEFALVHTRDELHHTPRGAEQAFRYHVFRRGPLDGA